MLWGICGYAQAGKDTIAAYLVKTYGWKRLAFADALKAAAYELNPFLPDADLLLQTAVDGYGWEAAKTDMPEVRQHLQDLGMAVRNHVDPLAWVKVVERQITEAKVREQSVVVTDVRFPNEVTMIRAQGGYMLRVDRPGIEAANGHQSEHAWAETGFDWKILNDHDHEWLHTCVEGALRELGWTP